MIDKFAEVVVAEIRKEMNNRADQMLSNRCKDMEDYRYRCGVLQGLAQAEEMIKDFAKHYEEQDE